MTSKVKIAFIDRNIEPSTETFNSYYSEAAQFAGKILNEGIVFDSLVVEQNLVKRSDSKDTFIAEETIMAHHEATMKLKNFYSKSLLQMKIDEVAEDLDSLDELKDELKIENPFDFIKGIIDGLEPKDSLEDEEYEEEEDFNKPSQNEQYKRRFEWPEEL